MFRLKKSKVGMIIAVLYLLLAAGVFIAHLYSVNTNPGDSGESAIPFMLLTLPWLFIVPQSLMYAPAWAWLAYPLGWLFVVLNALALYYVVALSLSILRAVACRFGFVKRG